MTIEEIYSELNEHMIKGLMIHEQMANYYDFLGLCGYKRCHEYHYYEENHNFRKLNRYYINHHNKLIPETRIDNPNIIPESWFKYSRNDVDASTKMNAVKNGMTKWVEWESDTKKLYEKLYQELINIGEIADASMLQCLICDVDKELKIASKQYLKLKSVDYNIGHIIGEQHHLHKKYKKMIYD